MIYQAQVKSAQATKWTTLKPDHSAFLDAFDQLVQTMNKGGSQSNQLMQIVKKEGSNETVIWKSY